MASWWRLLAIAGDPSLEPAYRALAIGLPSEGEIAQAIGRNVDPDSIRQARNALGETLGKSLEAVRLAIRGELETPVPYSPNAVTRAVNRPKKHASCLGVMAGSAQAEADTISQFDNADNMNDSLCRIKPTVSVRVAKCGQQGARCLREAHMADNPPVAGQRVSAWGRPAGPASSALAALMKHPSFSIRNPNRVRSLLGMFATANATASNAASGEGYELMCTKIAEIDAINPQVAARLMTAFRSWRMLEPGRRKLAQSAMKTLRTGNRAVSRHTGHPEFRILAES
ncbi:MAG: aminopeptidase N C-terminal domain-containing protein [Nitratireductor sp.]